jgi:hypothetical protein
MFLCPRSIPLLPLASSSSLTTGSGGACRRQTEPVHHRMIYSATTSIRPAPPLVAVRNTPQWLGFRLDEAAELRRCSGPTSTCSTRSYSSGGDCVDRAGRAWCGWCGDAPVMPLPMLPTSTRCRVGITLPSHPTMVLLMLLVLSTTNTPAERCCQHNPGDASTTTTTVSYLSLSL